MKTLEDRSVFLMTPQTIEVLDINKIPVLLKFSCIKDLVEADEVTTTIQIPDFKYLESVMLEDKLSTANPVIHFNEHVTLCESYQPMVIESLSAIQEPRSMIPVQQKSDIVEIIMPDREFKQIILENITQEIPQSIVKIENVSFDQTTAIERTLQPIILDCVTPMVDIYPDFSITLKSINIAEQTEPPVILESLIEENLPSIFEPICDELQHETVADISCESIDTVVIINEVDSIILELPLSKEKLKEFKTEEPKCANEISHEVIKSETFILETPKYIEDDSLPLTTAMTYKQNACEKFISLQELEPVLLENVAPTLLENTVNIEISPSEVKCSIVSAFGGYSEPLIIKQLTPIENTVPLTVSQYNTDQLVQIQELPPLFFSSLQNFGNESVPIKNATEGNHIEEILFYETLQPIVLDSLTSIDKKLPKVALPLNSYDYQLEKPSLTQEIRPMVFERGENMIPSVEAIKLESDNMEINECAIEIIKPLIMGKVFPQDSIVVVEDRNSDSECILRDSESLSHDMSENICDTKEIISAKKTEKSGKSSAWEKDDTNVHCLLERTGNQDIFFSHAIYIILI